jgi:pSer/pThr/pTyr-binding forkhead associated (FHA) protein
MRSPCVRLSLKGQTLADIPFEGDALRIGRMKENDVVIHNLSVSRFHATLTRDGDTFVVQDSGSENGIYVNGKRQSRAVVGPGDRILIGKHELRILLEGTADAAERPDGAPGSDAWDASNTYFVGVDTQAKMLQNAGVEHDAATDGEPVAAAADASEPPTRILEADAEEPPTRILDAEETEEPLARVFESDEPETCVSELDADFEPATELVAAPEWQEEAAVVEAEAPTGELEAEPETLVALPAEPDSEEPFGSLEESDPLPAEALDEGDPLPDPTGEYDVAAADLEVDAEALPETVGLEAAAVAPEPPEAAPPPTRRQYAGLIISRRGRFERVLRWDAERLCLGRAVECDVVLSAAEVSRNHTLLIRDGDCYEVRDLESINGTWVNGEKVSRRQLEVGDVIRIDEFELTFVLENGPIGDEIVAQAPEEVRAVPSGDAKAFTQLGEMLDLAPFDVGDGSVPAAEAAMSFDDPPSGEPATVVLGDSTPGRSDQNERGTALPLEPKPDSEGVLALKLKIRLEDLPEPLREALRTLEDSDLRLPVELTLETREG